MSRTEIISAQLADGSTIKIKATALGGVEDVAALDKLLPFSEVTDTIERIASALAATLKKVKPDKASVEFGLEIGLESGQLTALLVQGTTTANLTITLEWGE